MTPVILMIDKDYEPFIPGRYKPGKGGIKTQPVAMVSPS